MEAGIGARDGVVLEVHIFLWAWIGDLEAHRTGISDKREDGDGIGMWWGGDWIS